MEYLVPLVIVLVIVIVVIGAARYMGRKGRAPQDTAASMPGPKATRRGPQVTRELAAEASAKLTPEAHRAVYSLIARQQVLNAVQAYRKATGTSLGSSAAAVAALAEFPQPSPEAAATEAPLAVPDILPAAPKPTAPKPVEPKPVEPKPVEPKPQTPLASLPPSADTAGRSGNKPSVAGGTYRYRAIVSRGDEVREVASTRLNEELFGSIRSLALSGDLDGAARLLRDHADISDGDAREFVSMIGPDD